MPRRQCLLDCAPHSPISSCVMLFSRYNSAILSPLHSLFVAHKPTRLPSLMLPHEVIEPHALASHDWQCRCGRPSAATHTSCRQDSGATRASADPVCAHLLILPRPFVGLLSACRRVAESARGSRCPGALESSTTEHGVSLQLFLPPVCPAATAPLPAAAAAGRRRHPRRCRHMVT